MAKRVQILRDTAANVATFVGLEGEMQFGTDNGYFYLHTGGGAGTQKTFPDKVGNDALYQAVNTLLTNLAAVVATGGVIAKTGAATVAARTITAGNNVSVADGDGAAGNPTVSVAAAPTFSGQITGLTTAQIAGLLTLSAGLAVTGASALSTTSISGLATTQLQGMVNSQTSGLGNLTGASNLSFNSVGVQTGTQTGNNTFTFTNLPASGTYASMLFVLTLSATPNTVSFTNGAFGVLAGTPVLQASKKAVFFCEVNDGTNVRVTLVDMWT